jgi:centromere protein C
LKWNVDTVVTELEEPPSEEEEEAVGTRRSHRAKLAPLKFWLGEKLEYDTWKPGKSTVVPTILGVRRVPEHHESLQRKKRRSRQQSRSKSRRLQTEEPESDAEVVIYKDWDIDTDPKVNVVDYETGEMVEKRESILLPRLLLALANTEYAVVAFTKAMVVPKFTAKAHFKYQRIFSDERFFAAGQLVIPKGGEKPKKSSKDNTYVSLVSTTIATLLTKFQAFYVIEGAIRVTINETAFNLNPGGMFMVPRGQCFSVN